MYVGRGAHRHHVPVHGCSAASGQTRQCPVRVAIHSVHRGLGLGGRGVTCCCVPAPPFIEDSKKQHEVGWHPCSVCGQTAFFAHEQGPDEARVQVPHEVHMRQVGIGEARGVGSHWAALPQDLPRVSVALAGEDFVVVLLGRAAVVVVCRAWEKGV